MLIVLGYLQGMSDLLAPLLMILEDEVDTFWCFTGLMKLTVSSYFFPIEPFTMNTI